MDGSGYQSLIRALELLESLLARMPANGDDALLNEIHSVAGVLFKALHEHQHSAESHDGILPDLVELKPGLLPQSDQLEREHAEMLSRAIELQLEAARQTANHDYDLELIQMKAQLLRDITRLHLRESDTLTFEAHLRVEGGEGG